ncbi:DUF2238 domain-containing protein [Hamadaea flava]|uniref:DUF2238 domain-containing protein n=1 Tax=Hamadaea flava TaxID=1742688 RepID=A0ABV8LVG2_9ACTN
MGHFLQGFAPAILVREVLTQPSATGKPMVEPAHLLRMPGVQRVLGADGVGGAR